MLKRLVQKAVGTPISRLAARRALFRCGVKRTEPVSRVFGFDRGVPVDRYYIEAFLELHKSDIAGRVLEVAEATYTRRYGGNRVVYSDVLHAVPGNAEATIIGDLASGKGIPCSSFDCLVLTQTLPFIFDLTGAIRHAWDALKPRGVLLATMAGISQVSRYDADRWGDYWRLTEQSARRLFEDQFGQGSVTVRAYGNVLVACAFLQGLAVHELKRSELDYFDPDYPVVITVRAVRG
jgi:hypothetical protein